MRARKEKEEEKALLSQRAPGEEEEFDIEEETTAYTIPHHPFAHTTLSLKRK